MLNRDLNKMSEREYDVLVIGGGISGACIAWDAALRGLRTALVEKEDFSHATSAASSKLIHGGLRYLKNLEFGLVRESLRERRIWQLIAPHQVQPMPLMMPLYSRSMAAQMLAGLSLYDMLSFDRNRLPKGFPRIPGFKWLNKKKATGTAPGVDGPDLKGAIVFHDCQMISPERLTIEFLLSAAERGADLANYAEVVSFIREGHGPGESSEGPDRVNGVRVRDGIHGGEYEIRAAMTVNASGPWADHMLSLLEGKKDYNLIRSLGIHIITKPILPGNTALGLETPDRKHIFILPWRGHSIIGTTDTEYRDDPNNFRVTEEHIAGLIDDINGAYPAARIKREDVQHFYGGLRPLVEQNSPENDVYNASRRYEIRDPAEQGGPEGFITIEGGKYTTSRALAETVVDLLLKKLGRKHIPGRTAVTPLYGGHMQNYAKLREDFRARFPELDTPVREELLRHYGARAEQVLAGVISRGTSRAPEQRDIIAAQTIQATRREMALKLSDVLLRRTGLGTLGYPGAETCELAADIMAEELGWSRARRNRELAETRERYVPASPQTEKRSTGKKRARKAAGVA